MSPAALARRSPRLRWLALFAAICAAAATGAERQHGDPEAQAASGAKRQRGDPAAQAASDESALEYWDLVARFESNHRLFARYMITNEGPGDQYGVAVGHLVHPDGSISDFRNGRRKGRWHLSPDGLHMKVGSSYLDQREATRRFGTDNDRRGIKIHLAFVSDGPVTWREPDGEEPYRVDLLDMSAPVEGTIWVNGMDEPQTLRGLVGITHTVVDESESDLVLRRIDFFSLSHGVALYLSDRTRPDGARSRW